MKLSIVKDERTKQEAIRSISPAFIYNRFDLSSDNYEIIKIEDKESISFVEIKYDNSVATMGIWLADTSVEAAGEIARFVFQTHQNIKKIQYEYAKVKFGLSFQKDHFRILLPGTSEELRNRLSAKGRYNIKREKRLIDENVGATAFEEYSGKDISNELIELYFRMKETTHQTDYKLKPDEYIKKYNVTNAYTLKAGEKVIAILFSCEQLRTIYIENLTYDTEYSKYSPGQVLYDHYLARLIEKGFSEIYLGGGTVEYKKRYGSIEDTAYCGTVFRYKTEEFIYKYKSCFRKMLRQILVKGKNRK